LGKWQYSYTFLTLALDGGKWSASCLGHFTLTVSCPGTHYRGGWMGPRTGLDVMAKRKNPIIAPARN